MSTLSSTSTLAQIEAAYVDNASYAEDASVTKAKAFITACRILLLKLPKEAGTRDSRTAFNSDLIQREMETAQEWVSANDTASSPSGGPVVTRTSFELFR